MPASYGGRMSLHSSSRHWIVMGAIALWSIPSVSAQSIVAAQSNASRVVSPKRLLTLELRAVPLDVALKTIASEAGLQIAYKDALLPKKFVSMVLTEQSAIQAFDRILAGTGLVAKIS